MARLDPNAGYISLINTFAVDPANADKLMALLVKATDETMRHLPGFVSANLHLSLDRKHIANYAQWRSKQDFEVMMKNPTAQAHQKEAAKLATSFEPILYELKESRG